jgi:hypothetical protein
MRNPKKLAQTNTVNNSHTPQWAPLSFKTGKAGNIERSGVTLVVRDDDGILNPHDDYLGSYFLEFEEMMEADALECELMCVLRATLRSRAHAAIVHPHSHSKHAPSLIAFSKVYRRKEEEDEVAEEEEEEERAGGGGRQRHDHRDAAGETRRCRLVRCSAQRRCTLRRVLLLLTSPPPTTTTRLARTSAQATTPIAYHHLWIAARKAFLPEWKKERSRSGAGGAALSELRSTSIGYVTRLVRDIFELHTGHVWEGLLPPDAFIACVKQLPRAGHVTDNQFSALAAQYAAGNDACSFSRFIARVALESLGEGTASEASIAQLLPIIDALRLAVHVQIEEHGGHEQAKRFLRQHMQDFLGSETRGSTLASSLFGCVHHPSVCPSQRIAVTSKYSFAPLSVLFSVYSLPPSIIAAAAESFHRRCRCLARSPTTARPVSTCRTLRRTTSQ